jgi:hypothetical protein
VTDKLDKLLVKRYPKIFRDRHASPQKTCMCWGFPNSGWFFLIDQLCDLIQHRIDSSEQQAKRYQQYHRQYVAHEGKAYCQEWSPFMDLATPIPQVIADQVKEKFGTLRFYYHGGDERIEGYVSMTEYLSASTCEDCGAFGPTVGRTTKGWIHTACRKCAAQFEPSRKWKLPETKKGVEYILAALEPPKDA